MARLNNIPHRRISTRETINEATLKFIDAKLDSIAHSFGLLGDIVAKSIGVAVKTLDDGRKTWKDYETTTLHIAKNIGLSREQSQSLQTSLMESTKSLAALYGTNYKELSKLQESFANNTKRNIVLSREQLENQLVMVKLIGEQSWNEANEAFSKLGASSDVAAAHLGVAQERARRLGLNASQTSEIFAKNISVASKYHFKEGVNGLSKMVMHSQRLRINMESIASAADKFQSIEEAITTSSNLQVLGGSIGEAFSNPLEVMAMATTDMNGFLDRIESAFSDKGIWDDKNGVVKFDPVTMRMMREVSKQLGVSVDELNNIASSKVVSSRIDRELGTSRSQFTEEELNAIYNVAGNNYDAKTGKHYIQGNKDGQDFTYNVDELTPEKLKEILPYADKETEMAANVHDIAGNVARIAGTYKKRTSDYTSLNEREEGASEAFKTAFASWTDWIMKPISNGSKGAAQLISDHPNIAAIGSIIGNIAGLMFEHGGVVGGDSYHGDKVLARVNSGEMVLNQNQQSNLLEAVKTNPNLNQYANGGGIGIGAQQTLFNVANKGLNKQSNGFVNKISGAIATTALYKYGGIGTKSTNLLNRAGNFTVNSTRGTVKILGELSRDVKYLTKLSLKPLTKSISVIGKFISSTSNHLLSISKTLNAFRPLSLKPLTKPISAIGKFISSISNQLSSISKNLNAFRPLKETFNANVLSKSGILGKTRKFGKLISSGKWGDALNYTLKQSKFGVAARKMKLAKSGKYEQFLARRYGTVIDGGKIVGYGGKSLLRNAQLAFQDMAIQGDVMSARSASKTNRFTRFAAKYSGKAISKFGEFSSSVMELMTKITVGVGKLNGKVYSLTANVIDKIKIPKISFKSPKIGGRVASSASNLGTKMLGEGGKKALVKVGGKTLTKVGGKVLSVGAKALRASSGFGLASLGVEASNWGAKKLGLYKEGDHADKIAKIGAKTLEYAGYGAMLGSVIPILGNSIGATVGAAVGATIGTFEQYNKEIGDGLSSLLGQKDAVEQKRANNVAKIEQYEFERDKLGITNINDPQLQEKSYLATIGIHDLLISKFNKEDGLGEEGKSKEDLQEEKVKAKEGHWYDAITTLFGYSKGGSVKEPTHPLPVDDGDTVLARLMPGEVVLNKEQQAKVAEMLNQLGVSEIEGTAINGTTIKQPQVQAVPSVAEIEWSTTNGTTIKQPQVQAVPSVVEMEGVTINGATIKQSQVQASPSVSEIEDTTINGTTIKQPQAKVAEMLNQLGVTEIEGTTIKQPQAKVAEMLNQLGVTEIEDTTINGTTIKQPQVQALPSVGEKVSIKEVPSLFGGNAQQQINGTYLQTQQTFTPQPLNIHIDGTLKLVGNNNTTANIDMRQLCDNAEFKNLIYNYITSEMDKKGQMGIGKKLNSSAAQRGYGFDSSNYV